MATRNFSSIGKIYIGQLSFTVRCSVPGFRVKLGANDLNCVDVLLNPIYSVKIYSIVVITIVVTVFVMKSGFLLLVCCYSLTLAVKFLVSCYAYPGTPKSGIFR